MIIPAALGKYAVSIKLLGQIKEKTFSIIFLFTYVVILFQDTISWIGVNPAEI